MRRDTDPVSPFPNGSDSATARLKRADLASSAGAGILGFGLGALVAESVGGLALTIVAVGGVLHGWGMLSKRTIGQDAGAHEPWWSRILYWGCWIALALLIAAIGWRLLG